MITIDPVLQALIPPLKPDERAGLEASILREGCNDAIILWNDFIIDGHNRYEICTRNNVTYKTVDFTSKLQTRDDVIDWMYSNQLSRRNLTDESRTYLFGKQYEFRKKREGGTGVNQHTKEELPQNEVVPTSKKIATEQKVSRATVERAAEYSRAVDRIVANVVGTDNVIGIQRLRDKNPNPENKWYTISKKNYANLGFGYDDLCKYILDLTTRKSWFE